MCIQLHGVTFSYGKETVLKDISFTVKQGEAIALVGHNGSGKSTLVKHLNGLLKPLSGKVFINGKDTTSVKTAQLAGQVALLFQNPDDQICKRTVWDEVLFGPANLGYSRDKRHSLAQKALQLFELTDAAQQNPYDLGYSDRKRLAMASIVAMDTPVLILDEPSAGLDPHEMTLLVKMVAILRSENKTLIVITHDMDFAAENTDRAIALTNGQKVFDGRTRDLFSKPSLVTDCALAMPQVVQLSTACGLRGTPPLTPEECVTELMKNRHQG